jgi:diaminohydroxyphosphoribosylaminopyrimidine deaminase/5-amino-6-(5-phosphoribosylamino)uracil reductase
MALALALGRRGLGQTAPNPAVGAVLVHSDDNVIVGRGWTQPGGRPHAETEAITRAGSGARGTTLYVTLEPCSHHGKTPPCADTIIAAGIRRVVSAIEDPNPEVAGKGHAMLRAAGISVAVGIGAEEATRAHAGHISRMRSGRPHVTLKLAISADEKVALAGRRPVTITGEAARDRVHLMRAESDAIMIGIGTARADDPQLNCRLPGMAKRSPVRVILDTRLRLPPTSAVVATAGAVPTWVIAGKEAPRAAATALRDAGVKVFECKIHDDRLDLADVMTLLGSQGVTRLLVEAGPTLTAALIDADLLDEVALFRSRRVIGGDGIPAIEDLPLSALTGSPRLRSRGIELIGDDAIETFERA